MLFTIMPKGGLSTGTEFETPSIYLTSISHPTPEWLNTIDRDRPTGHILSVPPTSELAELHGGVDRYGLGFRYPGFHHLRFGQRWPIHFTGATRQQLPQPSLASGPHLRVLSIARDRVGNLRAPRLSPEATQEYRHLRHHPAGHLRYAPAPSFTLWPANHRWFRLPPCGQQTRNLASLRVHSRLLAEKEDRPFRKDPGHCDHPRWFHGGFVVELRAEHLGKARDRIYTLTATAADLAGNTVTATATCTVPHDQGK